MDIGEYFVSVKNDPEFEKLNNEILSFYLQHKDEYSELPERVITNIALVRATMEYYISHVKSGKQKCPGTCIDCVCVKTLPDMDDEYYVCDMAPSRVVHQPNLKLLGKRPSYCPLNETDYVMEAVINAIKKEEE